MKTQAKSTVLRGIRSLCKNIAARPKISVIAGGFTFRQEGYLLARDLAKIYQTYLLRN
jgi:phage FluMu protein gp41